MAHGCCHATAGQGQGSCGDSCGGWFDPEGGPRLPEHAALVAERTRRRHAKAPLMREDFWRRHPCKALLALQCMLLLHFGGLCWVLFGWMFTRNFWLIVVHVLSCSAVLVHHYLNDDTCILGHLEVQLRGCAYEETFVFACLAPILAFMGVRFKWCLCVLMSLSLLRIVAILASPSDPSVALGSLAPVPDIHDNETPLGNSSSETARL
jgi:hypothetical protein